MDHHKGSPEETLQMMQCGNLDLNFPIKYGILLLGNTKAGKTTSAHYLTHQILEGGYNDQKNVVYLLKNSEKRYVQAKIGDKESVSETQIPNFFEYIENGEKIYLVDCPGYLDTFGCYRVINNRFFHYQVFSKVERIKFIITFPFSDMNKSAELMKRTFVEFLSGFKNINDVKEQLIEAISVMITGVPKQIDQERAMERFAATPNLLGQFKQLYVQLKKSLVTKNRIHIFHSAEVGVVCDTQNTLLQDINSRTQFWKRNVNQKFEVDMSNIKISINQYIEKDQDQFSKELQELVKFYKGHVIKDINDLILILNLLVKDNLKNGDSFEFLKKMVALSQDKKKWREKESVCADLYKKYEQKRKKVQQMILKPSKLTISDSSVAASSEVPFWVAKLKVQKRIEQLSQESLQKQFFNNQFSVLDDYQEAVKNILISLIELAKLKKEKEPNKDKQKNEATLDLAYEIYKNIEISNKLFRLMKTTSDKKTIEDIELGLNFILIEYPNKLKSVFIKSIDKNSTQILIENLQKIKFDQNISAKGATEVAKFLESFKETFATNEYCQKLDKNLMKAIVTKLENEIIKLDNNAFEILKKQPNPSLANLAIMEQKRKVIILKIKQAKENAYNNQRLKAQNNRIVQMMAECLYKNSKVELAFRIYDLLFDAYKVFQILDIQEQAIRKDIKRQKELMQHLITYMEKAKKYKRTQVSLMKAQEAYHLAQQSANIDKLIQISKFIKGLTQNRKNGQEEDDQYLEYMFKQVCQVSFPNDIIDEVIKHSMMMSPERKK